MEYPPRKNPRFAACGLNCGLCPRYHTNGASSCPGCGGTGFAQKRPACGVLSCCRRHGLEHCHTCPEFPCYRYAGVDQRDSFITHKNQLTDLDKARRVGLATYQAELDAKTVLLETLLAEHDDGRRKSFFCLAVNLLDLADVREVFALLARETGVEEPLKAKAAKATALFEAVAAEKGIELKLRKKTS